MANNGRIQSRSGEPTPLPSQLGPPVDLNALMVSSSDAALIKARRRPTRAKRYWQARVEYLESRQARPRARWARCLDAWAHRAGAAVLLVCGWATLAHFMRVDEGDPMVANLFGVIAVVGALGIDLAIADATGWARLRAKAALRFAMLLALAALSTAIALRYGVESGLTSVFDARNNTFLMISGDAVVMFVGSLMLLHADEAGWDAQRAADHDADLLAVAKSRVDSINAKIEARAWRGARRNTRKAIRSAMS